jgi:SAM-dependent methyltransferase
MNPARRARLEQVYAAHPTNAKAVLERVRRERGTLAGLTACHLAESTGGEATDQNHAGGATAVRALAAAAGVQPGWNVLDIGAGLGGTLRMLAEEFGCHGHGVELTSSRFEDAIRLTRLVGLDGRVTFSHGDFMTVDVPGGPFHLAVAQGALMHFDDDPAAVLRRIAALLIPDGRLAIEDGVIVTPPTAATDSAALSELLHHWNGTFQLRDDWPKLLRAAGFCFHRMDDMSEVAVNEFEAFLNATAAGRLTGVIAEEHHAWQLALHLLRAGHLGFVRLVATLAPPD